MRKVQALGLERTVLKLNSESYFSCGFRYILYHFKKQFFSSFRWKNYYLFLKSLVKIKDDSIMVFKKKLRTRDSVTELLCNYCYVINIISINSHNSVSKEEWVLSSPFFKKIYLLEREKVSEHVSRERGRGRRRENLCLSMEFGGGLDIMTLS